MTRLIAMALALAAVCALASSAGATAPYVPKRPPLTTPWSSQVSTTHPLPDYPRPQLRRRAWMNLNGRWQYEPAQANQAPPFGRALAQTILVPFPVESPLSGIERGDQRAWYRRTFSLPATWLRRHVLLHFGAVSWRAAVYLNRHLLGTHQGDYSSFSFDATRYLHRGGNELVVWFYDPVGAADEPVGKQIPGAPVNVYHTASSGIWQTVWLEPVARDHVGGLKLIPDVRRGRLSVTASGAARRGERLVIQALAGRKVIAARSGRIGRRLWLEIRHPRLWSPSRPYLYTLRVRLVSGHRTLDRVRSYFAMRSISLGRVAGHTRLLLNGHFVFQTGTLDQALWPDGLYTAPTDAALRYDIQAAKRLGYDMIRMHVKVEADRWYYWADKLGILVWQDMPNRPVLTLQAPTPAGNQEFRRELADMVRQHISHPSIVVWTPFNEGWEQFDVSGITRLIHRLDPSRLVDAQSGAANCCNATESPASDIRDTHLYDGPFAVPSDHCATVIGEYGGTLPVPPAAHRWPTINVGPSAQILKATAVPPLLRVQYAAMVQEMQTRGLSASVYTELSGYEQELGILTYDRRLYSVDPAAVRRLNAGLIAASRRIGRVTPQRPRVPAGTTGLWRFDERHGTAAADATGHHNPLTLSGGAGWITGRHGGALSIGAAGEQAAARSPVVDTTRSFTISAWLNPRQAGESGTAVGEPGAGGKSIFSLGIQTAQQGVQSLTGQVGSGHPIRLPDGTWWTFAAPSISRCAISSCGMIASMHYDDGRYDPRPGQWHYVTGVYDRASQTISIFVDGIPEDVEHVPPLPRAAGTFTVGRGVSVYGASDAFVGAVDDLRTYGRALTPAEVWQLYGAESR